jgi:hypothetical protein
MGRFRIVFFIISLSLVFLCGFVSLKDEKYVSYFMHLYSAELFREHNLTFHDAKTTFSKNHVLKVDMSYSCYKILSVESARELLVQIVLGFLDKINKDPEMKERGLIDGNLLPKQLRIHIMCENVYGDTVGRIYIREILLNNGHVSYTTFKNLPELWGRSYTTEEELEYAFMLTGNTRPAAISMAEEEIKPQLKHFPGDTHDFPPHGHHEERVALPTVKKEVKPAPVLKPQSVEIESINQLETGEFLPPPVVPPLPTPTPAQEALPEAPPKVEEVPPQKVEHVLVPEKPIEEPTEEKKILSVPEVVPHETETKEEPSPPEPIQIEPQPEPETPQIPEPLPPQIPQLLPKTEIQPNEVQTNEEPIDPLQLFDELVPPNQEEVGQEEEVQKEKPFLLPPQAPVKDEIQKPLQEAIQEAIKNQMSLLQKVAANNEPLPEEELISDAEDPSQEIEVQTNEYTPKVVGEEPYYLQQEHLEEFFADEISRPEPEEMVFIQTPTTEEEQIRQQEKADSFFADEISRPEPEEVVFIQTPTTEEEQIRQQEKADGFFADEISRPEPEEAVFIQTPTTKEEQIRQQEMAEHFYLPERSRPEPQTKQVDSEGVQYTKRPETNDAIYRHEIER